MAIKYYKLLDMLQRRAISKGDFAKVTGFSSATVAKLSSHKPVNMDIIDRICKEMECQPGDILEYVPDPTTEWQSVNLKTGELSNTDFKLDKKDAGD